MGKLNNMKVKQSVEYNGKRYTLPFLVAKESLSTEQETVRNRFGGESCTLPAFAVAVYDVIMGSNLMAEKYDQTHGMGTSPEWKTVRKGLDWFRKYFAEEYMVLLD